MAKLLPVHVRLAAPAASEDQEEDEFSQLECFGRFRTVIVGIRYYTGTVNKNEMVQLVREPDNPYDRWAIRVDNVQGEKVGHLKREQVMHMAPLYDQGLVRYEGVVPGGKDNVYTLPVIIYCFGPPEHRELVRKKLRSAGAYLEDSDGNEDAGGSQLLSPPSARMSHAQLESSLDRMFDDLTSSHTLQYQMTPPPEVVQSPLYPHQKAALAWMVERENSGALPPFWEPYLMPGTSQGSGTSGLHYLNTLTNFLSRNRPPPLRGGILADDMGLGKTLTVISLIATNRPGQVLPQVEGGVEQGTASATPVTPQGRKRKREEGPGPTPKSLLSKAQQKKAAQLAELAAASTPPPTPPSPQGPKATLIVCPVSVLSNWQQQLEEHTMEGALQLHVYYGSDRNRSPSFLSSCDIVVTSYTTLAQELGQTRGVMGVQWLRVVLDEAHNIKNPRTQQCQAALALKAERRWAVTGTPVQNRCRDLFGLLSFLRLEPLNDRSLFNRTLERPLKSCEGRGLKSLQVLMGSIALRRTKDLQVEGRPMLELPSKTIHLRVVRLTAEDRLKYDRWELEGRRLVSHHLAESTLLHNYTTVLHVIMRLRQICDDGSLCPHSLGDTVLGKSAPGVEGTAAEKELLQKLLSLLEAAGDEECPICLTQMELPCITKCGHMYCRRCIESVIVCDKPCCPLCRQKVTSAELYQAPPPSTQEQQNSLGSSQGSGGLAGQPGSMTKYSAKVAALMEHLKSTVMDRALAADPDLTSSSSSLMANASVSPSGKAVVFSQFVGMLDKVEAACRQEGIPYFRLDGSTPARARADMVRQFSAATSAGGPRVFLISLKAGGVGINLTAANQVHLLDPWWNPSVEEQAMDRVHRMGQVRPVEVFRYIAEDTIEERMLELQERKRNLAVAAFDLKGGDAMRQMRIDDIKLLMEL